jgi:pectate lyase
MLIGGSDTVRDTNGWGYLSVTVHHNQFINCGQRMPRVRFGKVHVYNNLIRGTLFPQIETAEDRANKPLPAYPMGSALAVGHLAKVYSENNVFNVTKGHADDPDPTAADVVSLAHRATPTEGDTPDVGQQTYFFDNGTDTNPGSTLNGDPAELMTSVATQVEEDEDPEVLSTADVWKPADDYAYRSIAAGTVNAELGRLSGAGKLSVSER